MIKQIKFGSERERTIELIYINQSNFVKSKKITDQLVSGDVVVVSLDAKLLGVLVAAW